MIQTFSNLKLNIREGERELRRLVEKKLGGRAAYFRIVKKSLDARKKEDIRWVYTVECAKQEVKPLPKTWKKVKRQPEQVLIVGSGPAGLFCAVQLIRRGIRPIVVERGRCVEERKKDIDAFSLTRTLDPESNVQFGEGGAGTFSDGKLNTQTNGAYNREVVETFVQFGAPEDILYLAKPHIGSDNLALVVRNMREYIRANGGEVLFSTKLTDIRTEGDVVTAAVLSNGRTIETSELILALGHSARDTFEMLYRRGVALEQKEFAVGFRIEHLQKNIGLAQYGKDYSLLPAADYKLVSHTNERAAFTFCMCPGGFVMPAASEEGGVVVNGMSCYKRDGVNANSALVAQVKREDFAGEHPLAGIEFQRGLERKAFLLGGSSYRAPVQLVGDFLRNRASSRFGEVIPSYAAGTSFANLRECLPDALTRSIAEAIPDMGRRLRGFDCPDAVFTGVESRTSSPVRIVRGEGYESVRFHGLYPIGEGAGYAGGITSAAADGLRCADLIADKYSE